MDELVIQTHDFEESKNQLKKFSEETTTDLDLKRVDSGKGVGEFFGDLFFGRGIGTDHIVKGAELNSLTADIQQHLIDINNMQRSFIGEIGHVYLALESLDKDYIQAILIAVKSAQKANGEAKVAQKDIEKTIEEQKKIIKVLQQFKEKLDKFKHIVDIDKMWSELQTYQKEALNIQKSLSALEQHKTRLDKIKHLSDVDSIWSDTQQQEKDINSIKKENARVCATLESQAESISLLFTMKEFLDALEHISDIDCLWNDVQKANETIGSIDSTITKLISELEKQEKAVESSKEIIAKITNQKFIYSIDETKELADSLMQKTDAIVTDSSSMRRSIDDILVRLEKVESISHLIDVDTMFDEVQNLRDTISNLDETKDSLIEENGKLLNRIEEVEKVFAKRTMIAYALAGGSIGIAVIEFILAIMGLI